MFELTFWKNYILEFQVLSSDIFHQVALRFQMYTMLIKKDLTSVIFIYE